MDSLAQAAYEAYCDAAGGKSLVTGDNLPTWFDLPHSIRGAWRAAAGMVKAILEDAPDETDAS